MRYTKLILGRLMLLLGFYSAGFLATLFSNAALHSSGISQSEFSIWASQSGVTVASDGFGGIYRNDDPRQTQNCNSEGLL